MRFCKLILVAWLVLTVPLRGVPQLAVACCPAFRHGANIQIADQRILVAWDPVSKIEHFVREAGFRKRPSSQTPAEGTPTATSDFGFLVPSPSRPTIEAASGQVFDKLAEAVQPRIEYRDKWHVAPMAMILLPFLLIGEKEAAMAPAARAGRSVELLESKQVAGYDVSVLRADDAGELTEWLKAHGYDSRPELKEWAEPYVAKGWIITAFKYSSQRDRVDADAVRMSFETDRPIFPYRVPVDQIAENGKGNLLRTYVVGPGRALGTLGEGTSASPWSQARVRYAKALNEKIDTGLLDEAIPTPSIAALQGSWLTAFDDRTWPSGTEDLWFDFDRNAEPFQEVRVIVTPRSIYLPLDLIALAGLVGIVILRRRNRNAIG